jgi:tellurite resistance protein
MTTSEAEFEADMNIQELRELVDRALEDKKLSRAEMQQIMDGIQADGVISPEEVAIMEEIKHKVLRREIQVVD